MSGESSKSSASKATPIKAFKRDVRGLLSLQQESPSQSDVTWSSLDSPVKSKRSVGGKSKSLKSSNQLTPKNNAIRKKYYSSPILVARVPDNNDDEVKKHKNIENQRILEEFHRQFNSDNYVPRNILDNLTENLEDSIVVPDAKVNGQNNDVKNDIDKLSDFDYELTDQEDFDVLAKIEEQARQFLIEKETQNSTNKTSTKSDTKIQKPNESSKTNTFKNPNPAPSTSKKGTNKNDYFDSDDDDIILSIPLEQLTASSSNTANLSNKKEQPTRSNNFSHTSVIPTKRENINVISDKNRVQNQSNSKPLVQSKSDADNATSEPLAKRMCTAEEIAEKRRLAIQRRQQLQSLRVTQKPKN